MEAIQQLTTANSGLVALILFGVAVTGLVLAAMTFVRLGRVTGRFQSITAASGETAEGDAADSLGLLLKTVQSNQRRIADIDSLIQQTIDEARSHLQHIGMVRFDAFDGLAGQQSYSMCLLDANRNGVLTTSLVGNDYSRSYAVEIREGVAPRKLSDEERQALQASLAA